MLISNLSVLLAQRRLTISRVSEATRISRTTLTALAGGSAKGIQFETLNTLCQYLKITPGELFLYRPFDCMIADCPGLPGRSCVTFTLRRAGCREERCALDYEARCLRAEDGALEALRVRLFAPEGDAPDAQRARELVALLQSLPAQMLEPLEFAILRAFDAHIDAALAPRDYAPQLLWPWQV